MNDVTSKIETIKKLFDEVLTEIDEPNTDSIDEKKEWAKSIQAITMIFVSDGKGNSSGTKPQSMNIINSFLEYIKKRVSFIQERIEIINKI
jgi:hypothetical protein